MKIEKVNINELISPEYNPRDITPEEMEKLKTSIKEFGYVDPIIVNDVNNHIIGGNQRYEAMKQLGYTEVEVSYVNIPDLNREKALNIRLNNSSGEWDKNKLESILEEMELDHFDISLTGFNDLNLNLLNVNETPFEEETYNPQGELKDKYTGENNTGEEGSLKRDYIMPPFSILRGYDKDWLNLKKQYKEEIKDNGESREDLLYGGELGVSVTDPVLASIILTWFTPTGQSNIIDCFSGDTVIGYMSAKMGNNFVGIELRKEQCDLNNDRVENMSAFYHCDDGQNVLEYVAQDTQDLLFSCPPYYDMEVYSDLPNDASNQETYEDFIKIIRTAFSNSIKTLKDNRFAVIVASDMRDKNGYYYPFTTDIKDIFKDNGMGLYNDIILADPLTTAGIRARKVFNNRKTVKVHQNVMVFYKGDTSKISEIYKLPCEDK